MTIRHLHSIAEISSEACIHTNGSRPIRVLCSDMNQYVCKYYTGLGSANSLFNEYIAFCFLKVWKLKVPEIAFVDIKTDHIQGLGFPFRYFDKTCFGSQYNNKLKDVERFFNGLHFKKQNLDHLQRSYLQISLFDLWVSNDDRNENNFNLLYDIIEPDFVPIDHVQIFNGNNLDKGLYQIGYNESILSSTLQKRLFSRTLQPERNNIRLNIIESFKHDINDCHRLLPTFLSSVPEDWELSLTNLHDQLENLFSEIWISNCIDSFIQYFQIAFNHH
jgi:hypothetical protein